MPLNILWLQTGAQIGGTEMMNFRTWQWLDKTRFSVRVCFLDEPGPISDLYRQAGCEPVHLCYHQRPLRHVWRELQSLLTNQPVDLLHIFGARANLLGRAAARRYSRAGVICGQRSVGYGRRWPAWVERATSHWADLYIANSHAGGHWLQKQAGISPDKIITIHSGLDVSPFVQAAPGQIRPSLHIPAQESVIASIGNLRKIKDQETLLQAARLLQEQGYHFHLLLVGEGRQRATLERLIAGLRMQHYTRLLGRRTDVSAILADADIKVLSSRAEGLPAAILEAMAAGLPVVATAVGGVPELVQDGVTGRLVPPNNPPALAGALAPLLANAALRQQWGRAGRQRIQTHFAITDKVTELEQTYQKFAACPKILTPPQTQLFS